MNMKSTVFSLYRCHFTAVPALKRKEILMKRYYQNDFFMEMIPTVKWL